MSAVMVTPEVTATTPNSKELTPIMNINKMYESKYLKADDIVEMANEETETAVVTIESVTMEAIGQGQDQKPVVYFRNIKQGMILNKTNATTLSKLLGSTDTDDWEGKTIGLFATEVDFQGSQVLSIRVRMKLPKAPRKAAVEQAEEAEATIPF